MHMYWVKDFMFKYFDFSCVEYASYNHLLVLQHTFIGLSAGASTEYRILVPDLPDFQLVKILINRYLTQQDTL